MSAYGQVDSVERKFQLSGYVKVIPGIQWSGNFDSSSWVALVHNRINMRYAFSSKLQARLEIRNRAFTGTQVSRNPEFAKGIDDHPGYFDMSHTWVNAPDLVVHSVIDRAQLRYLGARWEVVAGRQRINWGMNTTWNPNDLFNAYNFLDFDYEERPGNDALRVRYEPTADRSLEVAATPGRTAESSVVAGRFRMNTHGYDLQFLGGAFGRDVVVGMGWAGSIEKLGFKGEWSYFRPFRHMFDTSGALSFSMGFDRTFKGDWYVSAAYLYTSEPSSYPMTGNLYTAKLTAKALFPSRHAVMAGMSKAFSPRTRLDLSMVYATERNMLILFPMLRYEIRDDLDVDLTIQSFFSSVEGGYGCRGTAGYLRLKWSF